MTAWPPADSERILLRSPDGTGELAVGPADVQVVDGRGRRRYPRAGAPPLGRPTMPGLAAPLAGGPGGTPAVARLRVRYPALDQGPGLDRLDALELLDHRGQVADQLGWSGTDAAAVDRGCAAAALPLEWSPVGGRSGRDEPAPEVVLRRPLVKDARSPADYDPQVALVLGRQAVTVVDAGGRRATWPRVGYGAPGAPAVARLRVFRLDHGDLLWHLGYAVVAGLARRYKGLEWVNGLGLAAVDDRLLTFLVWSGNQRGIVRRAATAVGLLVDYAERDTPEKDMARAGVPVVYGSRDKPR